MPGHSLRRFYGSRLTSLGGETRLVSAFDREPNWTWSVLNWTIFKKYFGRRTIYITWFFTSFLSFFRPSQVRPFDKSKVLVISIFYSFSFFLFRFISTPRFYPPKLKLPSVYHVDALSEGAVLTKETKLYKRGRPALPCLKLFISSFLGGPRFNLHAWPLKSLEARPKKVVSCSFWYSCRAFIVPPGL
jgi:hypothetical protein